jgi:hypothetical protein
MQHQVFGATHEKGVAPPRQASVPSGAQALEDPVGFQALVRGQVLKQAGASASLVLL